MKVLLWVTPTEFEVSPTLLPAESTPPRHKLARGILMPEGWLRSAPRVLYDSIATMPGFSANKHLLRYNDSWRFGFLLVLVEGILIIARLPN
jgi:hypothetical protein